MSAAQTGRTHDLHPSASKKPKNPLTRGRRPHVTHSCHSPTAIYGISGARTGSSYSGRLQRGRVQSLDNLAMPQCSDILRRPRGHHANIAASAPLVFYDELFAETQLPPIEARSDMACPPITSGSV